MIAGVRAERRSTTRLGRVALAVGLLGLNACGDEQAGADDGKIDGVGQAYVAVLSSALPDTTTEEGEPLPVLFVWEFADQPMSLDDQVVVIDHFDDTHDVRFVDEFDAAVDVDEPATPPRDDGLLVGLGPIKVDQPHTVRVEFYENAFDVNAVLVTIVEYGGAWTVFTEEPVEPEAFNAVT